MSKWVPEMFFFSCEKTEIALCKCVENADILFL